MDLNIHIATQVDIAIVRLVIRAKLVSVALQDIINPMDIIVMNTRAGAGAADSSNLLGGVTSQTIYEGTDSAFYY